MGFLKDIDDLFSGLSEGDSIDDGIDAICYFLGDYKFDRNNPFNDLMKDDVIPEFGSVVVCNLTVFPLSLSPENSLEHTGIYVGNRTIIHRDGDGYIDIVSPEKFLKRLNGFNDADEIYVSCSNNDSLINIEAGTRAMLSLNNINQKGYDLFNKNCHQFVRYCLTGENDRTFLDFTFSSLEILLKDRFKMTSWNKWKY